MNSRQKKTSNINLTIHWCFWNPRYLFLYSRILIYFLQVAANTKTKWQERTKNREKKYKLDNHRIHEFPNFFWRKNCNKKKKQTNKANLKNACFRYASGWVFFPNWAGRYSNNYFSCLSTLFFISNQFAKGLTLKNDLKVK